MIKSADREGLGVNVSASAAVFSVSDLSDSLAFYQDVLGFSIGFEFGGYAGIRLGSAAIHLSSGNPKPPGSGHVYFFCDEEVDTYFIQVQGKGASISRSIETASYGMRDFAVRDPDGNIIEFGHDSEAAEKKTSN
jgi:catechol 2,3-dioxygenase-like lactoylglutathione lyase family enzyme